MIRAIILLFIITQTQLNAQMDTTSYSIGLVIAKNLKSQGFSEIDLATFSDAMNDVFEGGKLKVTLEEANINVQTHLRTAQERLERENKESGIAFLEENKKRPEIITTDSGLQYEIMNEGTGTQHPSLLEEVVVHYHGTTIDGNVFESTVEKNEPFSFNLNGVIAGWQEGIQLMTVGAKYKFYIPFEIAYGARGAGAAIKPYSTLIFEVTLLEIK